jgi:hypothetical protein
MKLRIVWLVLLALTPSSVEANLLVTFEDKAVFTGTNLAGGGAFFNGNSGSGLNSNVGWSSQGVFFNNSYENFGGGFEGWNGWSYSNVVNTTTAGFLNQYASYPGGGSNGLGGVAAGQTYAIAYNDGFGGTPFFNLPSGMLLHSVDLTNTTYSALSMRNGDSFAKKFGGPSGGEPDLLSVTLNGYDSLGGTGTLIGAVTVNLADFRFTESSQDFILDSWQNVSLSSIANARSVSLTFFSTDVGSFGINTPTFVALDNLRLTAVPEPPGIALVIGIVVPVTLIQLKRAKRSKDRI